MHLRDQQSHHKVDFLLSQAPKNIPISFWVHEQNGHNDLKSVLKEKGLNSIIVCPLMYWDVKPVSLNPSRIEVADTKTFHDILATTFDFNDVIKEKFAELLQNVTAHHYLIYHHDQPVGTVTLIPNGKVGTIFNVAILPKYQKLGLGCTLMLHVMNKAVMLKLEKLILLSSPVGEKLYSQLGFIKSYDIEVYA